MLKFKQLILLVGAITFLAACGDLGSMIQDNQSYPGEEAAEGSEEAYPAEVTEESAEEAGVEAGQEAGVMPEEAPAVAAETAEPSLTGALWNLNTLNGEALLPDTTITAEFREDGSVSGSSGCNRYTSTYTTDGNSITINSSTGAATMMACPEPVMNQEQAYLEMLGASTTFAVSADSLTLFDANGSPVAVYDAISQSLAGSSWEVIGYNNGREAVVSVIIDTKITAEFGENGELTGLAGCNNYFGPYTAEEGTISMGPFGTTQMFCSEPEGIMDQEAAYLAALETAATYTIDGLMMNMRTADGATAANFLRVLPGDQEAEEPGAGSAGLEITADMVNLNTEALGTTWQAVVVPATPYDQSMPPGPVGLPEHIQVLFGGISDPADVTPADPVMYIIPVNAYRALWDEAGNDSVTRVIQAIQELNFNLPSPAPISGYPVLPYEQVGAGVNDLAVQVGRAVSEQELNSTSSTQDGYHLVGRWAQDANPVSNYGPRYVYQGFTNDGAYLVSFWWPVTTEALPNSSDITQEQIDGFYADPAGALQSAADQLNELSTDQWSPDLAALDAVVASLQIEGIPASGLVDTTWLLVEGPAQPGSSEAAVIEDPSLYVATYHADGTLNFTADCNVGMMPFELNNAGMTGGMLATPGPVTLAECGEASYSDSFIASLQAAQNYQVWAGGGEMELVLPAGGGVLRMRVADQQEQAAEAGESGEAAVQEAIVSGAVTNVDGAAIPEGASVKIQIQDTSLADAPATVMGEQIVLNAAGFPIDYEVSYDPSEIVENHTYTMSCRIEAEDGSLLFINDTAIMVITGGNPTDNVEIPVIAVGG